MKSEQSRVLLPAFNIKKSGAWPEMINPQHARAEKNTERRLGFNLCKLGSSSDKVVPGFRQTGAKVVLMADSHIYRARIKMLSDPGPIMSLPCLSMMPGRLESCGLLVELFF